MAGEGGVAAELYLMIARTLFIDTVDAARSFLVDTCVVQGMLATDLQCRSRTWIKI